MRRGGMRRWSALGMGLAMALTMAACRNGGTPPALANTGQPSASVSVSASPTPLPADPTATAEVCGLALAATDTTVTIFVDQTKVAELAVAQGDNAAMVAAAKEIDDQFVRLAETFTQLAKRPIDAALRERLTRTAAALTEMSSDYYLGSTVDTRVKLAEFQAGLAESCAG